MNVYHRTTEAAAAAIRASGFRDGEGQYMTRRPHRGVWVSDEDLGGEDGAYEIGGWPVLFLIALPDAVFEKYEWADEGKPYREALVPAHILNQCRVSNCENLSWERRPVR